MANVDYMNLPEGTAFRALSAQVDEGGYGERTAPAGAVGFVMDIFPDQESRYSVMFQPSGICGFWSPAEMESDAEILPQGHPDIPDEDTVGFAGAVRDLIYDYGMDHATGRIMDIAPETVAKLKQHAVGEEARALLALHFPVDGVATSLDYATADRLAELSGVADRLQDVPAPEPEAPVFPR